MTEPENLPAEAYGPSASDVVILRDQPVLLDHRVAAAYGVTTKQLNQAYRRNLDGFTELDAFQLTDEEEDSLWSRSVTSNAGRGGRRYNHIAYTRRGIVLLATILRSPRARQATAQIINLFVEVYEQLQAGRQQVAIANPGQYRVSPEDEGRLAKLRVRLFDAMEDVLDMMAASRPAGAIKRAIDELPDGLVDNIRERLREKSLQNEKLTADIQLVVAQTQNMLAQTRKTNAEAESTEIGNLGKKLELVEKSLDLLHKMEPSAVVSMLDVFGRAERAPGRIEDQRTTKRLAPPKPKTEA
jgi:hypothetical protein